MAKTPRLSISFTGPNEEEFEIEELTFNPFLESTTSARELEPASVWMEILLRRRGTGQPELKAPDIVLEYSHGSITDSGPTCNLDVKSSDASHDRDLNFVLHSDIWYSFVRAGEDREFMTTGYKMPVRMLYKCQKCLHHDSELAHITAEPWITRNNAFFSSPEYASIARRILMEAQTFNRVLGSQKPEEHFIEVAPFLPLQEEVDLYRLKKASRFAPVLFEDPRVPLKGRFGVRRLPWIADEGSVPKEEADFLYGISYGGSARISRDGEAYLVHPVLFSSSDSSLLDPRLSQGEGIRFWLKWSCPAAVDLSPHKERLAFSHQLHLDAPVRYLNSFLRMPPGFEHLPGGITPYKNYSVPPRLFYLWDHGDPNQCLASSQKRDAPSAPGITELQADFHDRDRQRNNLVDLFIVVLVLNMLTSIAIADFYFGLQEKSGFLEGAIWRGSLLPLAVSLVAAVRLYRGHSVQKGPLVGFSVLSLAGSVVYEQLVSSVLPIGVLVSFTGAGAFAAAALLAHTFFGQGAVQHFVLRLLRIDAFVRLRERRRFLATVKIGYLERETSDG